MSEKKTYIWAYYSIRDGEREYGEYEPVIIDGFYDDENEEERAKLEKILLFAVVGENEFGMSVEQCEENFEADGSYLNEDGDYRIGELGTWKLISKADFDVLSKYLGSTTVKVDFVEKVIFH